MKIERIAEIQALLDDPFGEQIAVFLEAGITPLYFTMERAEADRVMETDPSLEISFREAYRNTREQLRKKRQDQAEEDETLLSVKKPFEPVPPTITDHVVSVPTYLAKTILPDDGETLPVCLTHLKPALPFVEEPITQDLHSKKQS